MTDTPATLVPYLSELLAGTDIGLLELRMSAGTIRLQRQGKAIIEAPLPSPSPPPPSTQPILAPGVGVFRHRHPLHDRPLTHPGQAVQTGDAIGLLQIGPLLLPVRAPRDAVIDAHLAPDGNAVGYGTPLIRLREQA